MSYSIKELKENISILKEAYKRAAESGGVTSYSLNSGQGSTSVTQGSLASIRAELDYWTGLLNEAIEYESGSHCVYVRDMGGL
jgi:hypothetical protein|nr:MAG TPA: hypothetical protein [Caudoviricetes sp.]